MIDTLFGLVNEGMQLLAVAWNPLSRNFLKVGRRPLSIPDFKYSGSKPSTQITTVGCVGRVYSFECRVNFDLEPRLMFSIHIGLVHDRDQTLTDKTLIAYFLIGFQIGDFKIRLFREIIPSSDRKLCL